MAGSRLTRHPIVLSNEIVRRACDPNKGTRDEIFDQHDGIVDVQEVESGFDWELLRNGLLHECIYTSAFCQRILRSALEAELFPRRLKRSFTDAIAEIMITDKYEDLDYAAMWFYPGVNRLFFVLTGRMTVDEAFKDEFV